MCIYIIDYNSKYNWDMMNYNGMWYTEVYTDHQLNLIFEFV